MLPSIILYIVCQLNLELSRIFCSRWPASPEPLWDMYIHRQNNAFTSGILVLVKQLCFPREYSLLWNRVFLNYKESAFWTLPDQPGWSSHSSSQKVSLEYCRRWSGEGHATKQSEFTSFMALIACNCPTYLLFRWHKTTFPDVEAMCTDYWVWTSLSIAQALLRNVSAISPDNFNYYTIHELGQKPLKAFHGSAPFRLFTLWSGLTIQPHRNILHTPCYQKLDTSEICKSLKEHTARIRLSHSWFIKTTRVTILISKVKTHLFTGIIIRSAFGGPRGQNNEFLILTQSPIQGK